MAMNGKDDLLEPLMNASNDHPGTENKSFKYIELLSKVCGYGKAPLIFRGIVFCYIVLMNNIIN